MIRIGLACLVCSATTVGTAQNEYSWALPVTDGSTTLFSSADHNARPAAVLTADDVLLARCDSSPWCWAQDQHGHQGFVQRERIVALTAFDDTSAVSWMGSVFYREEALAREFNERYNQQDVVGNRAYGDSLNAHDQLFIAAGQLFTPYYCRTGDPVLLRKLLLAVAANPGSASEESPHQLASSFKCRPEQFKSALSTLSTSDADIALEATRTGLWLMFDDRDPAQQTERDKLIALLE